MEYLIKTEQLSYAYPTADASLESKRALRGINLELQKGDLLGIIGPAGAGKSTLLYALCGIVPHFYKGSVFGHVQVAGTDTFDLSLTDLSRQVGFVAQDVEAAFVADNVTDEIAYALENFGLSTSEIEARIASVLSTCGIADLAGRQLASLSGGQNKRSLWRRH